MTKPDLKQVLSQQGKSAMFHDRDAQGRTPTKMLGLRISAEDHKALKVLAAQKGITLTEATQQAISNYLKDQS